MDAQLINKLKEVPVLSLVVDDASVYQKAQSGEWEENNGEEFSFLVSFDPPLGTTLTLNNVEFEWMVIQGQGVLSPRISFESNSSAQNNDTATIFKEMLRAMQDRPRKRTRSESSEEDGKESTLPADLHDIALPSKTRRKIVGRRIKDLKLEELLDTADLAQDQAGKGRIVSTDRLLKAVIVLVRYRTAFHPQEANAALKFLQNVQDVACSYTFDLVERVVNKHLRAVGAGKPWDGELAIGRVDRQELLPLCPFCSLHHQGPCRSSAAASFSSGGNRGRGAGYGGRPHSVVCYNCNQRGHISRLCTAPRKPQVKESRDTIPKIDPPYKQRS
jgi:hypothetical protein